MNRRIGQIAVTGGLFAAMVVVVVAILLSQFGTVRDAEHPLDRHDGTVGGAGWDAVRGGWGTGADGAHVAEPGRELSVLVRSVGGVDGTVEVEGPLTRGWAVVVRWSGPGTYALAVAEPDEGTISLVGVVADRTRLLGSGPLPAGDGPRTVAVELDGPVLEVRVDGTLAVAGRDDDLATGTHAGVAVLGDEPGASDARFTRFRTAPPDPAGTRMITEDGP